MTTQTKVKNGTITLPKELRKTWKGVEVLIQPYKDKLIIEKPRKYSLTDYKAWEKAAGILRRRKMPDPVKWQRKIRQEWERKLL